MAPTRTDAITPITIPKAAARYENLFTREIPPVQPGYSEAWRVS